MSEPSTQVQTDPGAPARHAAHWLARGCVSGLVGIWRACGVARWQFARQRTRRVLAQLDDRLLHDIGITREEARREAEKPFWMD
jgi:uncharacterized protein YjiS (DUF1127 family)